MVRSFRRAILLSMLRAYLPLRSIAYPPQLTLSNGVSIVTRDRVQPANLDDLSEIFTGQERRHLRDWHLALLYEWEGRSGVIDAADDSYYRLADANVALQIVAPIGNQLAVSIEEDDPISFRESGTPVERRLRRTTHHLRFYGTTWSRMSGYSGMTVERIAAITNGVLQILSGANARAINPLRMYEHGLNSTNPYLRVFLWTSALDGILMSSNPRTFVDRLCSLLGPSTLVFPPSDGVFIERSTTVADVAADIYDLRSEVAHGMAINKKFGMQRDDMRPLLPHIAYGSEPPRYFQLLEEATLSLLKQVLQKIFEEDLLDTFANASSWRKILKK